MDVFFHLTFVNDYNYYGVTKCGSDVARSEYLYAGRGGRNVQAEGLVHVVLDKL